MKERDYPSTGPRGASPAIGNGLASGATTPATPEDPIPRSPGYGPAR